ncbi:MAG: hypothetical protein ACKVOR_13595 [Flavobacteriales bacterium]
MEQQAETKDIVTHYPVETYAFFRNVGQGILATNSFIREFGYECVFVGLEELEKNFYDLLSLPQNFKSGSKFLIQNQQISKEFFFAMTNSQLFEHCALSDGGVIFLKAINHFDQRAINNKESPLPLMRQLSELQNFASVFMQQLRLFKKGNIYCPLYFQINTQDRKITTKATGRVGRAFDRPIYSLSETEAEILAKSFKGSFSTNKLTELAISNFNLSYEIDDFKTKYITLMTALESIFAGGGGQISHTVSRHLALIISKSAVEFKKNYSRIRELYSLRNDIVHGGSAKEDIGEATYELQNRARQAINYCLPLNLNKTELFHQLNTLGYPDPP